MRAQQHVGRLSDSLPDDDDRNASRERLKRALKPTGKRYSGGSDIGNGEVCPQNPAHGKMFNMPQSGNDWCPHVDHSAGKL